jgi:molybdopterin converting factor small subunit
MPAIPVTVPGMLRHAIGDAAYVTIEAATLPDLVAQLKRRFPLLVPLVWTETGELRKHVLIFLNDTASRWLPSLDMPLKDGDRVTIVQAVSGG